MASTLDSGEYDSSFKFMMLDQHGKTRPLDPDSCAGKTVNVVVGPTGCGKTSMIRVVAGGDVEPSSKVSSTKNSTGYVVSTAVGEIIFWDTPGIMDTALIESEQRSKLLQDMVCAIRAAKVNIGMFVVLVDGGVARLPDEYYEWMTALVSIMPETCEKRILVTKMNSGRQKKRYLQEVAEGMKENCVVSLKQTGVFTSVAYIGDETPSSEDLSNMFKASSVLGTSAEHVLAPIHPDKAGEIIQALTDKISMLNDAKGAEKQIRLFEVQLAKEETIAVLYDTWWYRLWWGAWVQELKFTASKTSRALKALKENKGDEEKCNRIIEDYKMEARDYAQRLQHSIGFMDVLIEGAKSVEGFASGSAGSETQRSSRKGASERVVAKWASQLGKLKALLN